MSLSITAREDGPALVVGLTGDLDAATAPQIDALVLPAIDGGRRLLVFDLSRLRYISSAGLSSFLTAYRRLKGRGALRFAGLNHQVRLLFDSTGMTVRVDLFPTLADALAAAPAA
jgi:anti-sigma B factor antagonist